MADQNPTPVQPEVYGAEYFRNRRAERAAKRAKRHRLLFEIFGIDNVQSHFLAFDPFDPFYLAETDISPVNRTRKLLVRTNYSPRTRLSKKTATVGSTPLYAVSVGVNAHLPLSHNSTVTKANGSMPSQAKIYGFIKDTTKRTRAIGVEYGEAEMFLPEISSLPRTITWVPSDTLSAGSDLWGPFQNTARTVEVSYNQGLGATISQSTLDIHLSNEQARAAVLMPKYAEDLFASALPEHRSFDALREIGELKDLPGTIQATFDALLGSLSGSLRKDISSVYLNKEYGWDPLVKSLTDLVKTPAKIANRVNYLMSRLGKPTTFSASRTLTEPLESTTGFAYSPLLDMTDLGTSSGGSRKITLRSAINCLVKFPPLELPVLRNELLQKMWGLRFQPQDLYNLIPWTWLIDWFTGLGRYIENFCVINENSSIVNYGFLTYSSKASVVSTNLGRVSGVRTWKTSTSDPISSETMYSYSLHTSVLRYKYYNRKDYTNLRDMKISWDPSTLTEFQASILAALFLQRR